MEILLPALDELVQLYDDKVSKLGDTILFTCIKYESINIEFSFFTKILISSTFDDLSEKSVIKRLKKMDTDDDDDLLTVSRNCRPLLEHKLVSYIRDNLDFNVINRHEEHLWLFMVIFY
jgi:hypothetical protein